MKKHVEREELLAEVLAGHEECRAATLERGLIAMRRARARRRVTRLVLASMPVLVFAAMWMVQNRRAATTTPVTRAAAAPAAAQTHIAKTIAGTPIRVLTDDELLAFFKDRPVALMGRPGHQRLVLLDEAVQ